MKNILDCQDNESTSSRELRYAVENDDDGLMAMVCTNGARWTVRFIDTDADAEVARRVFKNYDDAVVAAQAFCFGAPGEPNVTIRIL